MMDTAIQNLDDTSINSPEFFFRKLFYESKDMLVILDFELDKILDVNEATLNFTGYTRQEFMKLSRYELTPKYSKLNPDIDPHETYVKEHARKVINAETITETGIFKKKDGSEILAEIEIIPTERKIGEAFINIKDTTENFRKKSEYQQTESKFKSIVETTEAGITIVDLKGNHTYVSPHIKKVNGYSAEEMIGKHTSLYFTKNGFRDIEIYTKALLRGKKTSKSTVLEALHKDGHSIWVQGTGTLIKDKQGKPIAVQTVFIDISDKVLLEQELQRTNEKYQGIIENLQGAFMFVDLNGNVKYVSPNYTSIIGYESSEVIGKKGLFIFSEEGAKEIRLHSKKLLEGEEESYTSTYKAFHKDGSELWLSGTFSVIKDKQGNPKGFVSVYLDETKKVLIEKELEGTKNKYQHIIENIDGVITITNLKGITKYVSPKILDILGYHPEEIIDRHGFDLFFESEHESLLKQQKKLIANPNQKIQHRYRIKHKDGSQRWINGVVSVMKDKEEKITGFVTVFFDITQDLELQQKLLNIEDRYKALFDYAIDPIVIRNLRNFEIINCNKAALDFFNLKDKSEIEELNNFAKGVTDNKGLTFDEIVKQQIKVAQKESLATFQVNYTSPEKEEFIIEINLILDSLDPASPKCIFFLKNVTERVLTFEKIAKERNLLNAVIEGTTDKILVQDNDRNVIAVNSNFKEFFEFTNGSTIEVGENMKLLDDDYLSAGTKARKKWDKKISSVLEGKSIVHQYNRVVNNKKEHFSLSASPLMDKSNEISGIISVSRNITELIEKNEEIAKKNEELQKYLDSNIQLENFAYIASHDLKQPLRTIISFSELLKNKKAELLDNDANTYINFILESSQRLNNMISDMLEYSVIGTAGEKESHCPKTLVEQVKHDLRAQIEQNKAKITVNPLPPSIPVFKSEFISLIQNLFSNSMKYCKVGVKPEISISAISTNEYYKFSVTDNGKGIEEKYLQRIFGMFQRLEIDNSTSGTGIGLAHCKKILELHEGEIWAESKIDVGTTFHFTIPK